jgi:hypothetical protein
VSSKSRVPAEIDFLASLERGEVVTQMRLSKRVAVSVGLVNALLKRAMHKGYVKAKSAPYKRYAYYLTPKGFAEKSRLVAQYLEVSLAFFRKARLEYGEQFARSRATGARRFALVGGGELAEIALLAAREADIEIVFVLDRETNKERFHGVPIVRSAAQLSQINAVVITDSRAPQQAFDSMREHFAEEQIFAPDLLRITRAPLDFKPKMARA